MPTNQRSCSECRNWIASRGECRGRTPSPASDGSAVWPITAADDWCGDFAGEAGHGRPALRVSDDEIVEMVAEMQKPMEVSGQVVAGRAYRRAALIAALMDRKMARTPAVKRIEKLVRQGRLSLGPNPWHVDGDEPGMYLWVAEKPETKVGVEAVMSAAFCGEHRAGSIREIHAEALKAGSISLTTLYRRVLELEKSGRVGRSGTGFYLKAAAPEIEV